MPNANNSLLFQLPGFRKPASQPAQQSSGQPTQSQPPTPEVDYGNTPQSWLQAAGTSAANNAINKFNNSAVGQMVGAYKRYRMGQAQNQTDDAMNQDMTNRTSGQPNMNGLTTDNADSGQFSDTGSDYSDDMAAMADGGIITKPTVALLGERGPEAVVPLNNPKAKITPGMFARTRYRPRA